MARSKQTARKSTGGKAPRRQIASRTAHSFKAYMSSQQSVGSATYAIGTPQAMSAAARGGAPAKTSFINHENTMGEFKFFVGPPVQDSSKELVPRMVLTTAVDPLTGNTEDWLGVNFRSCYDDAGMTKIGRPPIELVLVLDISGSMSCGFDDSSWGVDASKSKLGVAKRCIKAILAQLTSADAVGIVLFNQESHTLIPLTPCGALDRAEVAAKVDAIHTSGGTKLAQGFNSGVQMLAGTSVAESKQPAGAKAFKPKKAARKSKKASSSTSSSTDRSSPAAAAAASAAAAAGTQVVGRRVMFLTDMASSTHDEDQVLDIASKHAAPIGGCHTTVVGIGVDVSVGTVQTLSKIPGCKYFSVSSASEFEEAVASEFAYDVTPIAFNLEVALTGGRTFAKGFGSSELNALTPGASSFQLSSEFPILSSPVSMEASGAMYLFKLDPKAAEVASGGGANNLWDAAAAVASGANNLWDAAASSATAALGLVAGSAVAGSAAADVAVAAAAAKDGKEDAQHAKEEAQPLTAKTSWISRAGIKLEVDQVVPTATPATAADQLAVRKGIALTRYVDLQAEYILEDDDDENHELIHGKRSAAELTAKKAKHNGWVRRFEDFKVWFLAELAACNDKTVETGGSNVNIVDTINQIIDLERQEAGSVETAEAAAAAVAAVADGNVVLPASKGTPNEYLCPITSTLMVDPVIAVDGQTYERAAIAQWFSTHPAGATVLSPMTNKPLPSRALVPNLSLRKLIQDHVSREGAAAGGAAAAGGGGGGTAVARSRRSSQRNSAAKRAKQSAN